ncbi:hypothetical protein D3C80_1910170 [compost metagenome]
MAIAPEVAGRPHVEQQQGGKADQAHLRQRREDFVVRVRMDDFLRGPPLPGHFFQAVLQAALADAKHRVLLEQFP